MQTKCLNHFITILFVRIVTKQPYNQLISPQGENMRPTINQRLRYQFDNLMARGTPALITLLFVLSFIIVMIAGGVLVLTGFVQDGAQERLSFGEAVWESLMRTLDPGTMGADTGTGFRAVMLFVTLGGIFVVSTLIGVLNNAIENQME